MKYNIGIDLGGTNIKVGLVDENYNIVAKATCKTDLPRPAEEIADSIAETVWKALNDAKVTIDELNSIGIGTPGTASRDTGVVLYSCNLGFRNTDLRSLIGARLGKQVYVENDANAAAFGEVLAGAGKGCRDVVVVTLGTGVGGGIIIDLKVYSGFNYAGAELGHIVIVTDGEPCGCGRHGCWEAYSSATALIRMTARALDAARADGRQTLMEDMVAKAGKVSGRTAFDAMRAGDAVATEVVNTYLHYLAQGLSNIINIFQPEVLSIGGGISNEGDSLLETLVPLIRAEVYGHGVVPDTRICIAELKNNAGIIGGAVLGVR